MSPLELKYVDIFGQNISLNLEGKSKYRTSIGGFVTIFIFFVSVAYFEANIVSFWDLQNVKALQQKQFQDSPDVLILTDENFMLAVQVQQPDYITRPYFNITVKAQTQRSWPNGTTTKGTVYQNLIPCTFDRFDNVFRKYNQNFSSQYDQIGLSDWLCPSRDYNFSIGGRYTNEIFQYIKIEVTACVNGSSQPWSPTCAPVSEVQNYLKANGRFEVKLYITNEILNGNQPTNYTQAFLDDELFFYFIPNQIGDAVDIFFKKYTINTNLQIFPLLENHKQEILSIKDQGDFVQRVWQGSPSDTAYVSLFLRRSPYQIISTRSFQQFTDIMSLMGGFINVLLMMFGVIVGFYNTQQYRFKIANKVYNFDYGNNPQLEANNKVVKHLTKKNINITLAHDHGSQLGSAMHRDATILLPFTKSKFQEQQELIVETVGFKSRKDYLSAQIQGILSRSITLQIKFRFLINQMSCNRIFTNDRKCQLFHRASKQIDQDLDIYIILEKIKEVNLLKELILTPDQQILFNFTPKPVISVTEEMKILTKSRRRGLIEEDQKQSVRYFRSMTNKLIPLKNQKSRIARDVKIFNTLYNAYERVASGKQSQINGILINNLGREIKDIFEVSRLIDFDHIHLRISNRIQNKLRNILYKIRQQKRNRLLKELLDCQINQEDDKEMDLQADQLAEFQVNVLQRQINLHRR